MARKSGGGMDPNDLTQWTDAGFSTNMKARVTGSRKVEDIVFGSAKSMFAISLIILLILCLFMTITSWINSSRANKAAESMSTPAYKVRYEELGKQVVTNFLTGLPLPVQVNSSVTSKDQFPDFDETDEKSLQSFSSVKKDVVVSDVSLVYGRQIPLKLDKNDSLTDPQAFAQSYAEQLTYYVAVNGQPMEATVSLLGPQSNEKSRDVLPVLLDNPSLSPFTVNADPQEVKTSPIKGGWVEADINKQAVNEVLDRFVQAYAQNDQVSLQQLTQDPKGRKYVGLGGWTAGGNVKIEWAVSETKKSDLAVVRISFSMEQEIVPEKDEESQSSMSSTLSVNQTMDVLVKGGQGGLPAIVSWGPAGSWDKLEPYSVAVEGKVSSGREKFTDDEGATGDFSSEETGSGVSDVEPHGSDDGSSESSSTESSSEESSSASESESAEPVPITGSDPSSGSGVSDSVKSWW